jgi:type II secretory ATPase GspE/PulE/Tfp pilus assembly ATPase PilB-like protein
VDELHAVLLAEVTEIHEPTEPVADSEHEVSLALVEVESPEELTETDAVDEPTEAEARIALVEVDPLADTPEPTEFPVQPDDLDGEDPAAYADDLDAAIEEVLELGASAIHFSPQGEWHTVRARIDGLVRELGVVAKEDLVSLVDRLKASAAMRVDVVATKQGEKVILFPREPAGSPRVLAELGLTSDATAAIDSALSLPFGAIVVCGPVGSGTTTTLYAALGALNTSDRVVASIEDPVERVLDGIDQTEVDSASGVTFADGLRKLLSTDSDVVLVGEIRDRETAEVALQAALDGRHILAGLRAPSAAAAIHRLADMGLEPSVLGGALTCVVAQRLVRRVCADCRETYYASDSELAELGQPGEGGSPRLLARGRGCGACDGTGFRGRVGLFEILGVTEEIRTLVCDGASAKKIHRASVAGGMQTLRDDGVRLCLEGVTTAAEVQRILGTDR